MNVVIFEVRNISQHLHLHISSPEQNNDFVFPGATVPSWMGCLSWVAIGFPCPPNLTFSCNAAQAITTSGGCDGSIWLIVDSGETDNKG